MRKPEVRESILAQAVPPASGSVIDDMDLIPRSFLDAAFPPVDKLDYDPRADGSIAAIAERQGSPHTNAYTTSS